MANQNRQTLKQYFQTGNTPTQTQFADLIDSGLNVVDDSITCDANGQIGIGNAAPAANLNVRGRLFTKLSGTVSVANSATAALGAATSFDKEIAAGDAIQIGSQRFKIASITDATHLELATAATAAIKDAFAYRDANLLLVENGNGDAQFVVDKSGNVGIGIDAPTAKLHVSGKIMATELAGSGPGITNLNAANLEGTLNVAQLPALSAEQIPDLPASKITTGQMTADRMPDLTAALIPDLPASKITTGQLKAAQLPALTAEQIPDLPASKITTGQLKLDQLPALTPDQIPKIPASKITGQLQPDQIPNLPAPPDSQWIAEVKNVVTIENGGVALGPALPFTELVIASVVTGGLGPVLTLINLGGSAGSGAAIDFDGYEIDPTAPPSARIQSIDNGDYSSHLAFHTKLSGAAENSLAERLRITSDGNIGIGTSEPRSQLEIAAQDGLRITGFQPFITLEDSNAGAKRGYLQSSDGNLNFIPDSFHAQNAAAMVIENGTGLVNVAGTVRAGQFEGSGAAITGIQAANITGSFEVNQLPAIPASKIGDKLTGDQIVSLPAEKITGMLSPNQLPPPPTGGGTGTVSAMDITGVLNAAQLPVISEISGQLSLDQIPNIPSSKISVSVPNQAVGPGGRPLITSDTISPGSTQNVYAIPVTESAIISGPYSLEIYTIYPWVAWTDATATNSAVYNVMSRTVLAGMVYFAADGSLQIEPMSLDPTQTNHPDPKFPAVSCSIVSADQQAWLQISTTAGDPTLTIPPSQFSPLLQYYVYSLM